jgi:hypothetical protein
MGRGGARPAARRGGGRNGVLAFPARGRPTRALGRSKEAIPVLNLAEEGVEVGRRR